MRRLGLSRGDQINAKLHEVRQDLSPEEHILAFGRITAITAAISAMKKSRDEQIAQVKNSIQRKGACSIEEVCCDTRLPIEDVRACLSEMGIDLPIS